jgi:hypothetical protein
MAAQENEDAMLLWSVCYGGKAGDKSALIDALALKLAKHRDVSGIQCNPVRVAKEVLAFYMVARCEHCGGEGHQIIPGTITRMDEPCAECHGTGKPEQPNGRAFDWLLRHVELLLSVAYGRMLQKIDLSL